MGVLWIWMGGVCVVGVFKYVLWLVRVLVCDCVVGVVSAVCTSLYCS